MELDEDAGKQETSQVSSNNNLLFFNSTLQPQIVFCVITEMKDWNFLSSHCCTVLYFYSQLDQDAKRTNYCNAVENRK